MQKLHRLINLLQISEFSKTTKRFVLPVLSAFFLTIVLIGQIFEIFEEGPNYVIRNLSFFVAAFCAFTALKLFSESRGWNSKKYFFFSALFLAGIVFITLEVNLYSRFLLCSGLFLLISAAPFFGKENDNISYCNFSCSLSNHIFFSLLAAGILSLGSCVILLSIHYLFGLFISEKFYLSLSVFYFGFFAPLYFLSGIKQDTDNKNYPRGIKFITNFILIPLLTAYSVILYSYIIKIVILGELPKGILATMIVLFGSFGVLTHFFSYPLLKESNKLVRIYSQYFYHSLLIPLGFLFLAILQRVDDYGITEKRYLIILMGFWLLISCAHTIYTKARNLKFVTVSLAVIFIITSFGPWGIAASSEVSQVKRLENLLKKEGILVDGKIVKTTNVVSNQSQQEISSIVVYISETNKIDAVKKWFPDGGYVASLNDNSRVDHQAVMKDMGLQYVSKWEFLQYSTFFPKDSQNFGGEMIDLKGFDYAAEFDFTVGGSTVADFKNQNFNISLKENALIFSEKGKVIGQIDLTNFVTQVNASKQQSSDFILEFKNENFKVKLHIQQLRAKMSEKPEIMGVSAFMLMKKS